MNRVMLTAILALVAASSAAADLPLPPNLKYVVPRVSFVGVEKYQDYVFYVKLNTASSVPRSVPPVRFEVKNAEPFTLTGTRRRIADVYLLALKRQDFEKLKAEDKTLDWLTEKTPGVLAAGLKSPSTIGSAKDKEVPVTEYNVTIADGKLKAEMTPREKRQSELTPEGRLRPWVFGVSCALSLALFGVWFARRRRGL